MVYLPVVPIKINQIVGKYTTHGSYGIYIYTCTQILGVSARGRDGG